MIYPPRQLSMVEFYMQDFDSPKVIPCWDHSLKKRIIRGAAGLSVSDCEVCNGNKWLIQEDISNYLIIGLI